MMEMQYGNEARREGTRRARPDNDNRRVAARALPQGRSDFPDGVLARIERPGRSVTTSAPSRSAWRLRFERRSAPFIEPLMGYTGGRDTLAQVELAFPTLESAIRYAERQGLGFLPGQGVRLRDGGTGKAAVPPASHPREVLHR